MSSFSDIFTLFYFVCIVISTPVLLLCSQPGILYHKFVKSDVVGRIKKALSVTEEYRKAQATFEGSNKKGSSEVVKWTPPKGSVLKLNLDAIFKKEEKVGVGIVLRDGLGDVLVGSVIAGNGVVMLLWVRLWQLVKASRLLWRRDLKKFRARNGLYAAL